MLGSSVSEVGHHLPSNHHQTLQEPEPPLGIPPPILTKLILLSWEQPARQQPKDTC